MNQVHATAIVGPYVSMGTGNIIGPYAVLGGSVSLGNDNWIGGGSKIGCPPEVRSFRHEPDWITSEEGEGVAIGNENVIREDVQIHGGWKSRTHIGDRGFVMNQTYVAHDCKISDDVTLASGVALGGHSRIGNGANLGLGSTVHQGRVIGAFAMIGMASVVTRHIRPFVKAFGSPCTVRGLNLVGLERAGISSQTIRRLVEIEGGDSPLEAQRGLEEVEGYLNWFSGSIA